ncbi:uncharacterized protein [Apostichopus japonicus]
MSTLKDWKKSLSSGVSVRTLLGLDDESVPTEKKKTKLLEDQDKPSTSFPKEIKSTPLHEAAFNDVADFQKFEANLEVKGFLKEPQQFQWSSFPNSILVEQDTVKPEINLQPPIPAIPLKEILGPCFIAVSPSSSKPSQEDSSSDEGL